MSVELEVAVETLRARISETDAEVRRLNKQKVDDREAITALHKAMGVGRAKPRTATTKKVAVPEPLRELDSLQRILRVMADRPTQQWSLSEIAEAIFVPNHETVRKALARLKDRGHVMQTAEKNWVLAAPSAGQAGA